jgi:hypothetical protein
MKKAVPLSDNEPTTEVRQARLQARLSKRWPASVHYTRPGITRLCIDGFPRSANSMLIRKFLLSNRQEYKGRYVVAHHSHDVDSVLAAVLADIPVIMPVRRPEDCIPSVLIYDKAMTQAEACRRYLNLIDLAASRPQQVLVAPFELIVHDVNSIFAAANRLFGIQLQPIPCSDEEAMRTIEQQAVSAAAKLHGEQWASKVGVPSDSRATEKTELLARLGEDPDFRRCRSRYDEIVGPRTRAVPQA